MYGDTDTLMKFSQCNFGFSMNTKDFMKCMQHVMPSVICSEFLFHECNAVLYNS